MEDTNPIDRLLDKLPAALAKQKRAAIREKLEDIGQWEHYRQTISKPGKLVKISLQAAVIFKHELGLTDEFLLGERPFQETEILRISRHHYNQSLSVA